MTEEQGRRTPTPVVDRAALSGMAGDARNAFAALRPGGKPPARRTASGEEMCEISVNLKVVTPILGGGPKLRDVDHEDIIRVPTVRGHLRFWWRALYGHLYQSAEELYKDESALWGGPGREANGHGGRSEVEIRVLDVNANGIDDTKIDISDSKKEGRKATPGAFALWPAQSQREDRAKRKAAVPAAPRYKDGLIFTLTVAGPARCAVAGEKRDGKEVLKNVVRAWILFGGYGSRTRRGLGSLTVTGENPREEREKWLPAIKVGDNLREKISACFGSDIFLPEKAMHESSSLPRLAGAALFVSLPDLQDAKDAWTDSLGWLRSFRQGTGDEGARKGTAGAPGVSNWPEADKIRHLTGTWSRHHAPRHTPEPAFPRAGFGLPIVMKFKSGDGDPNGQFEILWRSPHGQKVQAHERLASPLILKALPLANGRFLPMALWLDRNDPPGSKVYVKGYEQAAADFDVLAAAGDTALFTDALANAFRPNPKLPAKSSLRGFFLTYIEKKKGVRRVAI